MSAMHKQLGKDIKKGGTYSIVAVRTEGKILNGPDKGKQSRKYGIKNHKTGKIMKNLYWADTGFVEDKFFKMELKAGHTPKINCKDHGNQTVYITPNGLAVCSKCAPMVPLVNQLLGTITYN